MKTAMTLTETLIAACLAGVVLLVAALGLATVRGDFKRRQAEQLLASLNEALSAYQRATGTWPTDPGASARSRSPWGDDGSGDRVIALLASVPASRAVLERVPAVLQVGSAGPAAGGGTLQDPWGRRLQCLTLASASPDAREAVIANRGRPIFISGGPDQDLGLDDVAATADNLRSDEPRVPGR